MATTTNYGWTTPNDTDLVKDGAAAIRTLGSSIDTTVFANAGASIAKSIVDAKGDIIAATADDVVARLAVGANGTVLTAASGETTGLKWAAPGAPASGRSFVAANESTSSTSYTNLTTTQSVTLTTGTKVLVLWASNHNPNTAGAQARSSIEISGATTAAPADAIATLKTTTDSFRVANVSLLTCTAGSNTFTLKWKVTAGSVFANDRELIVIDLGS
jgi:hypothetical protein